MKDIKLEFVESIFDKIPIDANNNYAKKIIIDFLLENTNKGKLYKYRHVNNYALDNLKNNTLFCASPSTFNDPFDCKIGIDFSSYMEYQFSPAMEQLGYLVEKFISIKCQLSSTTCSDEEKTIFKKWENSTKLMLLFKRIITENISEEEFINVFISDPNIITDLLCGIKESTISNSQLDSSIAMLPDLLTKTKPQSLSSIVSKESSFADFTKSFGIVDDADEITLTKHIFQQYYPEKSNLVEQMDQNLNIANKNLIDMMDTMFKLGCLCTDYKNNLMWSHYADGHKGFCIEYNFGLDCKELNNILILPVLYDKNRPKIPWDVVLAANKESPDVKSRGAKHMIRSLLTKDDSWRYEDEWRIIISGNSIDPNILMPPISCIYLGALCSTENKLKILKIAQELNIPVKQMTVDRGEYTLHATPIDTHKV